MTGALVAVVGAGDLKLLSRNGHHGTPLFRRPFAGPGRAAAAGVDGRSPSR